MVVSKQEILEQIQPGKIITAKLLTDITNLAADAQTSADTATLQTKVNELSESITEISEIGNNLFNSETVIQNARLDSEGRINEATGIGYFVSDYIPVVESRYYKNSVSEDAFHRVAFYETNKTDYAISVMTDNTFNVPNGVNFIRICGTLDEMPTAKVIEYTAIDRKVRKESFLQRSLIEKIDEAKMETFFVGKNKFNKDGNVLSGKYLTDKGVEIDNPSYGISEYIQIKPNTKYTYFSRTGGSFNCWYDVNKNFITSFANSALPITETSPSNAYYIRVSYGIGEKDVTQLEEGDSRTQYVPFSLIDARKELEMLSNIDFDDIKKTTDLVKVIRGRGGVISKVQSASAYQAIRVDTVPENIKKNNSMSLYAQFEGSFVSAFIGKGEGSYRGSWLRIDGQTIEWHVFEGSDIKKITVNHTLNISKFIAISLSVDENAVCHLSINSIGGTFSTDIQMNYEMNGILFAKFGMNVTDVSIGYSSIDFQKPIWLFGDSYFGVATNRILGNLKKLGYWNVMTIGLAGLDSSGAYNNLMKSLNFGTPKFIVWCLGMNDNEDGYKEYLDKVITLCKEKGIELILYKVPTVPTRDKSAINAYMEGKGLRYVDAYKAVGANSDGTWYDGFQAGDGVHPTQLGAKAISMRMLIDVPEIMQYGYSEGAVNGEISEDM